MINTPKTIFYTGLAALALTGCKPEVVEEVDTSKAKPSMEELLVRPITVLSAGPGEGTFCDMTAVFDYDGKNIFASNEYFCDRITKMAALIESERVDRDEEKVRIKGKFLDAERTDLKINVASANGLSVNLYE